MEAGLAILGLVVLAIPLTLVILLISHLRLRREVKTLRASLEELRSRSEAPAPRHPPQDLTHSAENVVSLKPAAKEPDPATPPPPKAALHPDRPAVWDGPRTIKAPKPPRQSVVFTKERLAALIGWLKENWFYAIAALSLALAGLFLVQYGIETGLLSPEARIGSALVFGLVLIGAGEAIRRRWGDSEDSATAYLPSVLSGAGLVSLMGAILSARMLYDLIAPGPALFALFAIALAGLVLGWFHGALLAAIGLIGGLAAPFLVGGESTRPEWLYLYFALLCALGLGIDTLRRWAWISVLALIGASLAGLTLFLAAPSHAVAAGLAVFAVALTLLSVLIPARALTPDHQGPSALESLIRSVLRLRPHSWPIFPVRLSLPTTLFACVMLVITAPYSAPHFWISLSLCTVLTLLFTVWARPAPALQDHALLSATALLALIALPETGQALRDALSGALAAQEGQTETRMAWDITLILLAATLPAIAAAWQSLRSTDYSKSWAGGAVLLPPLAGLALELTWVPTSLIGAWPWAFHALGLAALMTVFATRFAAKDGDERLRSSLAIISALASLSFACSVILFEAALTLALAATVLVAAALDRRFNLPLMGGYIAAGIIAISARLVVDPGLSWAVEADFLQMLAGYGGTLAALVATYWVLTKIERPRSQVFVESAILSVSGLTLCLTLFQILDALVLRGEDSLHWEFGLYATIWVCLTLTQLMRLQLGGAMRWLRILLGGIYGLLAFGALGLSLIVFNPLFSGQTIAGPILFNTLIPAYLLPALTLCAGALYLKAQPLLLRRVLGGIGLLSGMVWLGLTLRHGFRGADQMTLSHSTSQPELYSYTVALLAIGTALFFQAVRRKSDQLRRVGVLIIAAAVAKVFLIDISGLQGLARALSFLLLGLSLAGLAWFNRWVQLRTGPGSGPTSETQEQPAPEPTPPPI